MAKKKDLIDVAHPHTIRKFELIEKYIKAWAQKLLQNKNCNSIVFIDCMCNCGIYKDEDGKEVEGTAVRVAKTLLDAAHTYANKNVHLYFNDLSKERIEILKQHLPQEERNYQIVTSSQDAGELLRTIGPQLYTTGHMHYFLLYDPYDASIDWEALIPFFRNWGEVLINHMVSDSVRAISSAKKKTAKEKYENTYLEEFEKLVPYGSDKAAYEKRVEEIIEQLKGDRTYYVSAFPFHNSKKSQLYSLVHCTSNIEGFKLYKECAWQTFGGQSSSKRQPVEYEQLSLNLDPEMDSVITVKTDESCYTRHDIAKYLQKTFAGRKNVRLDEIWGKLDQHPVFPSIYRNEIKSELMNLYGAQKARVYNPTTRKNEETISFK